MCVNVMRWIGKRIQQVEERKDELYMARILKVQTLAMNGMEREQE